MAQNRQRIVIGTDGSPGGTRALHWAADAARDQDVDLHIVCTWSPPLMYGDATWGPLTRVDNSPDFAGGAQRVATESLAAVGPDVHATASVTEGQPLTVILAAADDASMVVVGSRGRSRIAGLLLGSVGNGVAAQAGCAAVVVRGPTPEPGLSAPILVGYDGSDASEAALAFAVERATRRSAPVHAVTCWRPSLRSGPDDVVDAWLQESRNATEARLAASFLGWQEKYPDVTMDRVLRDDHPVEALSILSEGAQLVVVGAHARRGPRASTALGSVSQGVLHHVNRTVAVLHT